MNFVAIKTPEQSDLLSLHRVRSRLVRQRTATINQIRGSLIERGITAELDQDWHRLDERLEALSVDIKTLSENDCACQRLMTVPGIGPIISSAVVAAIEGSVLCSVRGQLMQDHCHRLARFRLQEDIGAVDLSIVTRGIRCELTQNESCQ
jgi:hypothetical protein